MITIVTIGRKHEDWIVPGLERYTKRLRQPFDVEWVLLPHSALDGDSARREESERLLGRIDDKAYVVLLDETGRQYDSPAFSNLLEQSFTHGRRVVLVIGGAFGVDERMLQRADVVMSLSALVFPHQLVRLVLVEQLYRCQEISRGGGYHHS